MDRERRMDLLVQILLIVILLGALFIALLNQ